MSIFERLFFEPAGGMFREFDGVKTFLEPKDHVEYRKLLPQPLTMPDAPVVLIFFANYMGVYPWPMTRYQEWAVALKCVFRGEESWHVAIMAVTKWVPMKGGRYLGFPKYIPDDISLIHVGNCWNAQSRYKGKVQLALEFQPGINRSLAQWENELIGQNSFFSDYIFQLVPPARGPRVQKVNLEHQRPPSWAPVPGMVKLSIDPSEPWAELVPAETLSPGVYGHFSGGINLVAERLV